jgi:hypothetical protein
MCRRPILFDAADRPPRQLLPLQVGAKDIEEWLLAKSPTAIGAYNTIGAEEYARSFTAAQTAGTDIADDLYFGIVDVVGRGGTEQDFSRLVTPILKSKGWLGGDDRAIATRVALIYDTNLRLARAAGRWNRYQASKSGLPYVRGVTAEDERVRHPPKSPLSDHRAFDGIILPLDHPFVAKYWTPLGFRCRCQWIQMTRSQLARYPGGITSEADLAEREKRLGPPVFASPAAPIKSQLASMVDATNAERMPGMPAVDPVAAEQAGTSAWLNVIGAEIGSSVGEALARLFG